MIEGTLIGVIKGDTRSLDYSSYEVWGSESGRRRPGAGVSKMVGFRV